MPLIPESGGIHFEGTLGATSAGHRECPHLAGKPRSRQVHPGACAGYRSRQFMARKRAEVLPGRISGQRRPDDTSHGCYFHSPGLHLSRRERSHHPHRNDGNRHKRVFPPTLVFLITGGLTGLLCALLIYYSIYGWNVSPYLAISQNIGFIFSALPIKLYVLFVDPTAIYGQGTAILKTYPWIFISLIGVICCLMERSRLSIVAACVLFHIFFYVCYADLLPTNIWHFKLIHYLKWAFPLLGLFA